MTRLPAISLAARPGRRQSLLDTAVEVERLGFHSIWVPGLWADSLGLCASLAHVTHEITFGTGVQPIYVRHPADTAAMASYVAELAPGRFRLGLGVSHVPMMEPRGLRPAKPLSEMRAYVRVDNLFDETAFPSGWRAAGRTAVIGVRAGF